MVFAGGHPFCIIECKAPEVLLTPNTVLQAGVYNTRFNCPWLMVTNGLATHWFYFNGQRLEPAQEPDWT